ncbi:hypothetical protein [Winogradskyella ursingii]|uniref:hypothetical protein n=1 Tax=Winogradskyella ursingii TaxID=2686079 RepID=UPI0015C76141|nr:hypothetical protein [Winogradskyella ursingii]
MKFFNKARQNILEGNRVAKYVTYAIGEILLVVIGILIALWINNWNNDKQLAAANDEIQQKVLVQLQSDINELKYFKKDLDTLNEVYLKYLDRSYDATKTGTKNVFSIILFEVTELGLENYAVNLIDNAKLNNSEISEKLIDLSSIYKLYFKNISDVENIIYRKVTSNLEIIEASESWYTELMTDFKCKTDCVNYLTQDESFKARIASLRFLYVNAYGDMINGFIYELENAQKMILDKLE